MSDSVNGFCEPAEDVKPGVRSCRRCGRQERMGTTCRSCLDQLRNYHLNHPDYLADGEVGSTNECKECAVDGCTGSARSRGLCMSHYCKFFHAKGNKTAAAVARRNSLAVAAEKLGIPEEYVLQVLEVAQKRRRKAACQ